MIKIVPPLRKYDKWGGGHFGAPRGGSTHRGIDIECPVGSMVLSPVIGLVTKFGYCYSDDLSFRYVQITNNDDLRFRFFYVNPLGNLAINDKIKIGDVLGYTQDLGERYKDITPHVHFEIKNQDGEYLDPNTFL